MKLLLWIAIISVSGCASLGGKTTETDNQQKTASSVSPQESKDYPTRPFETDTLYNLLVAEIAGQRSQYDLALEHYLIEAKNTQDPWVAARASRIAQYLNEPQAAAEAADIWRKTDKKNIHAHVTAATNWLKQHQIPNAISALKDALAITDSISLEQVYLTGKELPQAFQQPMLDGIDELLAIYPKHIRLHFTKALLLDDYNRNEEAIAAIKTLQQAGEMTPPHYIMLAKLYSKANDEKASLNTLSTGWNNYTGDKTLGLLYGQALADDKQTKAAVKVLDDLLEEHPSDDEVILTSALLKAELGYFDESEALLLQTTDTKQKNNSWYFLGQLYEQQNKHEQAIHAYSQVGEGKNLISAVTRATTIIKDTQGLDLAREYLRGLHQTIPDQTPRLIQIEAEFLRDANELSEALTLYNEALELEPNDSNLLYGRAMVFDLSNDIVSMEADLKTIINNNPNNAIALNALGYTLADKTDRLEEAKDYIERAFTLNPKDPAIIDSLGWIYFRLGDVQKAELLLAQAYTLFKDQEVAAHLGEVLWVQGKKEQALKVWIDGLRRNPTGAKLISTMKRFNIDVNLKKDEVDHADQNEQNQ
ncbi:tetratricopeptide repeat protein [Litoribacillus peritrichatus]|uniref:Tetratricopeptide repeat protein n=1 Tax=Litoribacillus peritrichatus TaxID=718191 RepID=A0ABP7MGN7_9GAMM